MVTNVEIFENHKKEGKSTIFFDSKKVIESNCSTFLLEIFSWQWSLFAARVRTVMEWEKSGKKKKNHPQSSIPDTVKFILEDSKILRSRGQMPGMLRWSNLMIFMQRACATYVPSISSWIFKLLYDATFFQFFFVGAMASWSRDKNNRIKMELKDV